MGQALYRKYRSTSLSEIVGQEHITTALKHALDSGRLSHAYLFTGPRGTGKTSIARILAHAMNDMPYSSDPQLDIIEIDAASNRRIDEIRDLRDKVYIAPASATYKVYIIDEVHMLTREAFNALLKTLEEPPAHVVFILATTDAHKLPETIISRTQRYSFRPVATKKVAAHLRHIADAEGITIDDAALELLAEHGGGSFRDSISMLDQVSNQAEQVTADDVRRQLGIVPAEAIAELIHNLSGGSFADVVQALQALVDQGFRAAAIAEQLSERLRQSVTGEQPTDLDAAVALSLLKQLLEVPAASNPERLLELLLIEVATPARAPAQPSAAPPKTPPARPVTAAQAPKQSLAAAPMPEPAAASAPEPVSDRSDPQPEPVAKPEPPRQPPAGATSLDDAAWSQVLTALKKQYNTLYGIVRMAHTDFSEPGVVALSFTFAFHQKRINDAKNRKIVIDTIKQVSGQPVELRCVLDKTPKARAAAAPVSPDNSLQDISSVFGGGELL